MKKIGRKIGYARISDQSQDLRQQISALKAAGCVLIFREKISAVGRKRPEFDKALRALEHHDTLVVLRVDRAFRSTIDAILTWQKLCREGKHLAIAALGVVSDTPEGRHFFRGLASAAEFERDLISIRTRESMATAKRNGAKFGRPRKLPPWQVRRAHERVKRGVPISRAARSLRVSHDTPARAFTRLYQGSRTK